LIGPGDKRRREIFFEIAPQNSEHFPGISKKLYSKYTQIYKREFLLSKDYDDPNLEDLKDKIKRKWGNFIKDDFIRIINKMTFPIKSNEFQSE